MTTAGTAAAWRARCRRRRRGLWSSGTAAASFSAAGMRTRRLRGRVCRSATNASLRHRRALCRRGLRLLRLLTLRRRGAPLGLRRLLPFEAAATFAGRPLLLRGRSLTLRRRSLLLLLLLRPTLRPSAAFPIGLISITLRAVLWRIFQLLPPVAASPSLYVRNGHAGLMAALLLVEKSMCPARDSSSSRLEIRLKSEG